MESYKVENLTFKYPNMQTPALYDISLNINKGEFVTLCGISGCGKTTLLRLLKPMLAPHGTFCGNIYFQGNNIDDISAREQAEKIGFVMQNPDNQLVTDKVWHELAFGLESLGIQTFEIRSRIAEMASFFGIAEWFHTDVSDLSGGQKQLLNLAAVMVMQPSVLLLDEPTSQLDPIAAQEFLQMLRRINTELGVTVVLSEHRLEDIFSISDRVVVLDSGRVIADAKPCEIGKILYEQNHVMYRALPASVRIFNALNGSGKCPTTVRDGKTWLLSFANENPLYPERIEVSEKNEKRETAIELCDVNFRYHKNSPDVIRDFSFKMNRGELLAVVGGNGTGKTTVLSLISGLNKPQHGKVLIYSEEISKVKNLYTEVLAFLPQDVQTLFTRDTVRGDLGEVLAGLNISEEEKKQRLEDILSLCEIAHLAERHPFDLSGGEAERAGLAKVLLKNPKILLLDEPTKGMDAHFKQVFAKILKRLTARGVAVVMVSHDIEFCAEFADRCSMLFDGNVVAYDTPREFFSGKSFYTTSANRMARDVLPSAVLARDVILACGGEISDESDDDDETLEPPKVEECKVDSPYIEKWVFSPKTFFSLLLFLIAVPLTIYIGTSFFGNRKYYFISIMIILETFAAFFIAFESRKPKARELIIISVLCAIAVAGRLAFAMIPQFKPVVAIVIISGIAFGGEVGFLVGAIVGFVSNFFIGQGPWAPWQMFALGVIGLISGLIFKRRGFKSRFALCVFGFLATFIIYGGIMNPASVIMWQAKPTLELILSAFVLGAPFDLVHATATAVFLWLLAKPMLKKLNRIKIKYGILERRN